MKPNCGVLFLEVRRIWEKAVRFGGESTGRESQLQSLALLPQWWGTGKSFNLSVSGFPHLQNRNDNICPASPQAIVSKYMYILQVKCSFVLLSYMRWSLIPPKRPHSSQTHTSNMIKTGRPAGLYKLCGNTPHSSWHTGGLH